MPHCISFLQFDLFFSSESFTSLVSHLHSQINSEGPGLELLLKIGKLIGANRRLTYAYLEMFMVMMVRWTCVGQEELALPFADSEVRTAGNVES